MDDILNKYTSAELLDWIIKQDLYPLTKDIVIDCGDGETQIIQRLDKDKIQDEFLKSVYRYSIVKRGHTLYIHNNETCKDIMQFKFTDENYEYVSNTAQNLLQSLNNREVSFTTSKKHCDCY